MGMATRDGTVVLMDMDTGEEAPPEPPRGGARGPATSGRLAAAAPRGSSAAPIVRAEDLGQTHIEGLPCRGRRVHLGNGEVAETWLADGLADVPVVSRTTGRSASSEFRLTEVELGEPSREIYRPLERRQQSGDR
jgi:hypothetical protein